MQNTALDILKTGQNLFLTGSAGTGKTYILHQYILYLKKRKIIPTIVAPTGIAASHLHGQTIHSFFALGIRSDVDAMFVQSLVEKKYLQPRFKKLKVLIIDEISMVSPEVFDSIDKILQAFKQSRKPFGGIQVILSGDFFQLPPISKLQTDKRFAWQSPSWRDLELQTCYLEKKFRQDDNQLIYVLDEIRAGKVSDKSYEILNSRFNKELSIDHKPTNLYTHNIDVDRINNDELNMLPSEAIKFLYSGDGTSKNIEKIFKSGLLSQELSLKKDAVVMFIKNNNEKGYTNGTTGVVIGFDKYTKNPIVKISNSHIVKVEHEDWTIENESGKVLAKVSQIPLKLAWAITIHKSQGMTLDSAQIDLSKTFEVGQGYVALSRIKNIEGLKLIGLNDTALSVDPLILHIDPRIKQASQKAKQSIESYTKEELESLYISHIKKLGGTVDKVQIEKETKKLAEKKGFEPKDNTPTHIKTKQLFEKANNLKELAEARDISISTIIKHLRLIKQDDDTIDLSKFLPDLQTTTLIKESIEVVKKRANTDDFGPDGTLRLKPIFIELNEKVSYDDIRLVLL
ncbi:MAG: AAA family ATPase [Campylobacterota bacterium]|nr:AAA family ATPase [Campylobacterota bacterium]